MMQQSIGEIEKRIRESERMDASTKAELLKLLSSLKLEIDKLSKTHGEQAEQIAGAALISAEEATRDKKDPKLLKSAVEELAASVTEFEASHPKLVEAVNRVCLMLSSLGI